MPKGTRFQAPISPKFRQASLYIIYIYISTFSFAGLVVIYYIKNTMIEITYSTLFILVTAILTTALMLSLMNNLIFIIINFISTIVGVGMILLYMDNGFVCF